MKLHTFSLIGAGILLIGAAGAVAVSPAEPQASAGVQGDAPLVGDFLVGYARAMGLVGEKATPEQALSALRAMGVVGADPVNLTGRLTEGDVVRISRKHLKVTTTAPERAFSSAQVKEFFDVFGGEIRQISRGDDRGALSRGVSRAAAGVVERPPQAADPATKGKGKHKGLSDHFPF